MEILRSTVSEKNFMKTQGKDLIIHGLFVDDVMHIPACSKLNEEFIRKSLYSKNFDITGGGLMEKYLSMELKQPGKRLFTPG